MANKIPDILKDQNETMQDITRALKLLNDVVAQHSKDLQELRQRNGLLELQLALATKGGGFDDWVQRMSR